MSKYIDCEAEDERTSRKKRKRKHNRKKRHGITTFDEFDVSNDENENSLFDTDEKSSPAIRNVTPGEKPAREDSNKDNLASKVSRLSVDDHAKKKLAFQDDEETDDDSSDAELLALIQPSSSAKHNPALKKNYKIELYYEYLQGGLLMIGALQEDSEESGFFIQVMAAIRKELQPMQQIDARFGCSLCASPYSDQKKVNKLNIFNYNVVIIVKKYCTFLNSNTEYPGDSGERLVLQKLVDFANTYGYSKAEGGLFEHPNWDQYTIAKNYNRTQSPKRKIGDVVVFSDAKHVVNSVLGDAVANSKLWERYRKFAQLYFSPPYPQNLKDDYGFPLGTPTDSFSKH
jgi:hypothetical protein